MNTLPQYWSARTPLRVRVLGLFFLLMTCWLLGLLWLYWGQSIWLYAVMAIGMFISMSYVLWKKTSNTQKHKLCFDELSSNFSLIDTANKPIRIHILRVWQSPFAITMQIQIKQSYQIKQLTFWRGSLSASCWRKLHIYLWRYQLQYQLADLKGT